MAEVTESDKRNFRRKQQAASAREIGAIPPVVDWSRRERCEFALERFLLEYLPESFPIPFSAAHRRNIARIQKILIESGRYIQAIPRGYGKSTITEGSALWALLYGHRKFVPIITSGDSAAGDRIESVKTMLEVSDPLFEDFPEVCHPIRALEGIPQRAGGQLHDGKLTNLLWSANKIVLPTVPEIDAARRQCRACGSVLTAAGITSKQIRGLKHKRPDGVTLRPDFVFIDDPQTDESAVNPTQVEKLLRILTSAIFGLSGHAKAMSIIIACNVIAENDLIERLLDPDTPYGFEGERVALIEKFPDALDGRWEQFRALIQGYDKEIPGDAERAREEGRQLYLHHQEEMDAGCVLSWPEARDDVSESGVHYAMTKYYTTPPEAFAAEFQNKPLANSVADDQLTLDDIAAKILPGQPRGTVPAGMERLTGFIDIQGKCLFWLVAAWGEDFTGHVVDYGCFPEQGRRYYTVRDLPRPLSKKYPGRGREALWRAALDALSDDLLARKYERNDGAVMRVERLFPDGNDGNAREVVYEFCRNSKFPTLVMPYISRGVCAGDQPFSEYRKKHGDQKGFNWRIPGVKGRREIRHILADVNFWKSFVRERWRTGAGDPGALTLFAGDRDEHRLFFEHMVSEYSVRTAGRERTVDEWSLRPNYSENHWWDCLVGAAVAASYCGSKLPEAGDGSAGNAPRRWKTLKEARAMRRAANG